MRLLTVTNTPTPLSVAHHLRGLIVDVRQLRSDSQNLPGYGLADSKKRGLTTGVAVP